MLRATMTLLLTAALLAGCSPDPKTVQITPALLENPDQIQKISNRLEPADRELFGRYVLGRTLNAQTGFGQPITNAQGKDPATVAEAIDLMKAVDATNARREALTAEQDVKLAELDKKLEALNGPMEASGWAPKETEAYNAVVREKNAVIEDYRKRFEALK